MPNFLLDVLLTAKDQASQVISKVNGSMTQMGKTSQETASAMNTAFGMIASQNFERMAYAVADFSKKMINAQIESEKVGVILEATLRSTGRAAEFTSDELNSMATELSNLSGVDDEAIISAETMALRFENISKEIFPDVMKTALDMSVALGTDVVGATQTLARALEAPEQAGRMLRSMNVILSDSEQDLLKSLVETGRGAEAQAMIMDILKEKYGGTAEAAGNTLGGALNKLNVAQENFLEKISETLATNEGFQDAIKVITDLINSLGDAFAKLPEGVQTFVIVSILAIGALGKLAPILISLKVLLGAGGLSTVFAGLGSVLSGFAAFITGTLLPALGSLAAAFGAVLLSPIGLLIAALVLLTVTIVTLGPEAKKTFMMIADIIAAALKRAGYELDRFFSKIRTWASGIANNVKTWFKNVGTNIVNGIKEGIQAAWASLVSFIQGLIDDLVDMFNLTLEASSPSKLFAREVGMPIAEGVAMGIREGMKSFSPDMIDVRGQGGNYRSLGMNIGRVEYHGAFSSGEMKRFRRMNERITEATILEALGG